jgi:predicted DNA-binding transcriptional regulator YafY
LLAFLLSLEVAQRHLGTALENSLRSAIEKIAKTLKGPAQVDLAQLRAYSSAANPLTAAASEGFLLELYQAARTQRQVQMRYFSNNRGEWTERTVNPHHLYYENDAWYLFAYDHLRGEMRNFHLGRIAWLKVLSQKFERNPGFSVEDWMGHAFQGIRGGPPVPVEIQFDAHQARWIRERRWAGPNPIKELADGGLILRLETSGLEGVKQWVMQYGRHAEVLSPPELRAAVAEELRAAGERYID